MMAIVQIGGKQYQVSPGDVLKVEKLVAQQGEEVTLDKVLMIENDEGEIEIGSPVLDRAQVKARVVNQGRDRKIIVYKFKRRKNYHRKYGHRQSFTNLKIEDIQYEK